MKERPDPELFYKYCPIYNSDKILKATSTEHLKEAEEFSLVNLWDATTRFTSRTHFNDPFDTKIRIHKPNKVQIAKLLKEMPKELRTKNKPLLTGKEGTRKFIEFENFINDMLDDYVFYCVSGKRDSNLMWSHYANEHKGLCIEWFSKDIKAKPVEYSDRIADLEMIDMIRNKMLGLDIEELNEKFETILRVKLDHWRYENEYRLQLNNDNLAKLTTCKGEGFRIVKHDPKWIKSIIFGGRMDERVKKYIYTNYPHNPKPLFLEAYFLDSKISFRRYTA